MKRILVAAAIVAALVGTASASDLEIVMKPDVARMTGEINAAANRCGFAVRESERIFEVLPLLYLEQGRDDLLDQSVAASLAFQDRYENDPVEACNTARSRNWGVFE